MIGWLKVVVARVAVLPEGAVVPAVVSPIPAVVAKISSKPSVIGWLKVAGVRAEALRIAVATMAVDPRVAEPVKVVVAMMGADRKVAEPVEAAVAATGVVPRDVAMMAAVLRVKDVATIAVVPVEVAVAMMAVEPRAVAPRAVAPRVVVPRVVVRVVVAVKQPQVAVRRVEITRHLKRKTKTSSKCS